MASIDSSLVGKPARGIPYVTADEAFFLLQGQFEQLLALLETLGSEDWERPTACTAWNVRDMVAHQAGGYASGTGYGEMIRQYRNMIYARPGMLPEDSINEAQLRERAGRLPAALIEELRAVGPTAMQKWAYQFRLAKLLQVPHPVVGMFSARHLMWVIHSRDTWMHRLDICRATGRPFVQSAEQDGRIVELVMLDVEKALRRMPGRPSLAFHLSGVAGGSWNLGDGEPAATVQMDALDFNILASGRSSYAEARAQAGLTGDVALAERVLNNLLIVY